MITMKMNDGFYSAIGTPTTLDGKLIDESFSKQIEMMIDSGTQGILCLGSMGNMAAIRNTEYPLIAKRCFDIIQKRIPLMIGVMDCSISKILDRIDTLEKIKIEGVVTTVPFYYKLNSNEIINFYTLLARKSKYPIYIYDLPGVTQSPITLSQLKILVKESNIAGIKTGNLNLIQELLREELLIDDKFSLYYSNLDLFDVALKSGINKNLDGMFTCTPYNTKKMYEKNNNEKIIAQSLTNILKLRNLFIKENVLAAYSYAMGLLDCPGNYHTDYALSISEELKREIFELMSTIKEL